MKKLLKNLSTLLLACMIVIGCISLQTQNADALKLVKYVTFVGKSGDTIKVKASNISLYGNAVYKCNSSELDFFYKDLSSKYRGKRVLQPLKSADGPFIKLNSFYAYQYNKYAKNKYTLKKFVYVQRVDKLKESLNGRPVYVLDKSCSDRSGNTRYIIAEDELENVSGNEYVAGKNDSIGRCWTPKSKTLANFCKYNNISKIKVGYSLK